MGFQVLSAWRADFGDQTVVYRRVAPRVLPPLPRAEPIPLSAQEAEALRLKAEKKQEFLFLSCTVYDRRVTEMRWEHEGRRFRAYSNIDGNYLRGLLELETADTVYALMLGMGEETEEDLLAANAHAAAEGRLGATPAQLPPRAVSILRSRNTFFQTRRRPHPPLSLGSTHCTAISKPTNRH